MSPSLDPDDINEQQAEALIERLQRDALSEQDKTVLVKVIRSYLYLARMVQQAGAKLRHVRQFLLSPLKKKPPTRTP